MGIKCEMEIKCGMGIRRGIGKKHGMGEMTRNNKFSVISTLACKTNKKFETI